jgi:hypothetical protein
MPNHPEHEDHPRPEHGNRRLLLAAAIIALAVVLVILHLSGVIGGSHA